MSDWKSSQFSNGVYGALAKLMPGDRLIADRAQTLLQGPVKMSVPSTELLILAALIDGTDVSIELLNDFIEVRAKGTGCINGSFRSAVMVTSSAHHCTVEDLVVNFYNTSNSNGHAAIFGYKCQDLTVRNCRTLSGNGNGVRLDGVVGGLVVGNKVYGTGGSSSEGITLGAKHVRCERNIVDRAWETGILVFAGPGYTDIDILHNVVSNSAQDPKFSHPGIGVSLNGSTVCGLTVAFNTCYDDQVDQSGNPAPTQSHIMAVFGPGKIRHGRVLASTQKGWGNQYNDPFTIVGTPDLTEDWIVA